MTTFGSTEEDSDPIPKEEFERLLSRNEKATVGGLLTEMEVLRQKMELCYEKLDRMTTLYMQLDQDFRLFKQQRAIELNHFVGGGPTAHGPND